MGEHVCSRPHFCHSVATREFLEAAIHRPMDGAGLVRSKSFSRLWQLSCDTARELRAYSTKMRLCEAGSGTRRPVEVLVALNTLFFGILSESQTDTEQRRGR